MRLENSAGSGQAPAAKKTNLQGIGVGLGCLGRIKDAHVLTPETGNMLAYEVKGG